MRSRLLQRIHLAYLRYIQQAQSNGSTDEAGSYQVLSIGGDSGSKDGERGQYDSGDAILTATSIRMSLAILQCLGPASEYCPPI